MLLLAEGHAEAVPGKAREDVAAQPFGNGKARGEGEDAGRAGGPDEPREAEAEGIEEGEPRGQAEDAERQRPGELVRLHQEGGTEPPQAGEKIAEAEPPADRRGRQHRARRRAPARPVDEPDGERQANEKDGPQPEGRHGEGGERPCREGRKAPSPAPGQDDAAREAGERQAAAPGF